MTAKQIDDVPLYDCGDETDNDTQDWFGYHLTEFLPVEWQEQPEIARQ